MDACDNPSLPSKRVKGDSDSGGWSAPVGCRTLTNLGEANFLRVLSFAINLEAVKKLFVFDETVLERLGEGGMEPVGEAKHKRKHDDNGDEEEDEEEDTTSLMIQSTLGPWRC